MSKGLFRSHNKVGQTWSFQTITPSGTTFDPLVQFSSGSDRVSWDLGVGGGYVAGNSLSYTYVGDTGTTKTVTLRTNRLSKLTHFRANEDDVSGHIDFTGWDHMSFLQLNDNPSMTGITNTPSVNTIGNYEVDLLYSSPSPGLTGTLDVSMLNLAGRFYAGFHPLLTKIDHGSTLQAGTWANYWVRSGGLVGNHDMSMFTGLGGDFQIFGNGALTGITHTASTQVFSNYYLYGNNITGNHNMPFTHLGGSIQMYGNFALTGVTHSPSPQVLNTYQLHSCDITGNHNMPFTNLGGDFRMQSNNNLTNITHSASTQNFTRYWAQSCQLTGDLDLSMLTGLGGDFQIYSNSNLTSITHTASTQVFDTYRADACGLIGNHDLSMFPNLGGYFNVEVNGSLTGITHTASTQIFTNYSAGQCNLIGNHDLSMFPNLGGKISLYFNNNLTGITYTASTQTINNYQVFNCDITGTHDLRMFPNLGGNFEMRQNANLTSILHTASTQTFSAYHVYDCGLTGTLDVSMLTSLGGTGSFLGFNNPNLTNISFPLTTQTFKNSNSAVNGRALALHECNLGYVNFLPLSGATMDVGSTYGASIGLEDNAMTTEEVNHILVDFSGMSNTYNPAGWTGVTLDISGTNYPPDSSCGGYDGIAAFNSLTGASNNWNITISSTAPNCLLDDYPNALGAFSLRKLRLSYSGSSLQIQRLIDAIEVNVGFDCNGEVSMDSLVTAVSGSTAATNLGEFVDAVGYADPDGLGAGANTSVVKWYDQSSNGYDLTQIPSPAYRPAFTTSGSFYVINGKPSINFDGVSDTLTQWDVFGLAATSTDIVHYSVQYIEDDIFIMARGGHGGDYYGTGQYGNTTTGSYGSSPGTSPPNDWYVNGVALPKTLPAGGPFTNVDRDSVFYAMSNYALSAPPATAGQTLCTFTGIDFTSWSFLLLLMPNMSCGHMGEGI